jgi:hypothetical protein
MQLNGVAACLFWNPNPDPRQRIAETPELRRKPEIPPLFFHVNNRLHPLRSFSQSITHFAVAVSRRQISNIYPAMSSAQVLPSESHCFDMR